MKIADISIKRPSIVIVVFTALSLLGILSYLSLNYELLPKFSPGVVSISTIYPGASPNEVENTVTKKLEDAVASMENVKKIDATSFESLSVVVITLTSGADVDLALNDAQRKVNAILADLPDDAKAPTLAKFSLDDLPILKNVWPRKGDQLFLSVRVDDKERMWGQLVSYNDMLGSARPASGEMHNDDVKGVVVNSLKAGSYVELEGDYLGFIHPSEREREPRLGETIEARVIGVREDAVLYLSMLPRAHEVLGEDAAMLLEIMSRTEEKRIPYTDRSSPEDIREYFAISKGQFKRAIGRLMKEGLAEQDQEGSYLTEKAIKEI